MHATQPMKEREIQKASEKVRKRVAKYEKFMLIAALWVQTFQDPSLIPSSSATSSQTDLTVAQVTVCSIKDKLVYNIEYKPTSLEEKPISKSASNPSWPPTSEITEGIIQESTADKQQKDYRRRRLPNGGMDIRNDVKSEYPKIIFNLNFKIVKKRVGLKVLKIGLAI
ncbi:2172_t:CDS:2 [Funneliformis geosporum]|nr:2172_t:CDS:2 [Funneliformis geosporum]